MVRLSMRRRSRRRMWPSSGTIWRRTETRGGEEATRREGKGKGTDNGSFSTYAHHHATSASEERLKAFLAPRPQSLQECIHLKARFEIQQSSHALLV